MASSEAPHTSSDPGPSTAGAVASSPESTSGGWKPALSKRSLVWEYFYLHDSKPGAKCRQCGKVLNVTSTTTLRYHLKHLHKVKVGAEPGTREAEEVSGASATQSQPQITHHFKSSSEMSTEKMLSHLAAVDGISFQTLAYSTMLRKLWKGQGYKVPTSHPTVQKMVMQYAEKVKGQMKKEILLQKEKGKKFSLTMDEWTSVRNRRYAGLNLHGEHLYLLGLIRITGSMPAEKAKDLIEKKLLEYELDLSKDIVGITTDGATVMKKMGKLMPIEHQVCTLHGLHLAVTGVLYKDKGDHDSLDQSDDDESEADLTDEEGEQESLPLPRLERRLQLKDAYHKLIIKVRKICSTFRRSPLKNDLLEAKCQQNGLRAKPLLQDTKTRWNSMLAMLKRFLEIREPVKEVFAELGSIAQFPTGAEISQLADIVEALEVIEEGSLQLSRDDCDLDKADTTFKFMLEELRALTSPISHALLSAVQDRIKERRKSKLAALLSILKDPMEYGTLTEESVDLVYPRPSDLVQTARDMYIRLFLPLAPDEAREEAEPEPARKSRKERLSDLIAGKKKEKTGGLTMQSTETEVYEVIKKELKAFVSTEQRPMHLQKLYDAILTLPPSSIAAERSFSISKMFISRLRSNLNDETVNNLMVLRSMLMKSQ